MSFHEAGFKHPYSPQDGPRSLWLCSDLNAPSAAQLNCLLTIIGPIEPDGDEQI